MPVDRSDDADVAVDGDLPVFVTTTEAALLAHVEPATVRRWKSRRKLRPVARTQAGHLLFDLASVFAVQRGDDPRKSWDT